MPIVICGSLSARIIRATTAEAFDKVAQGATPYPEIPAALRIFLLAASARA